ncbi:dynamin family protein [Actinosynnema sp. NPDC047251]|uniref:Isoniazid-inducible protein n=1 Tax=Saccharothrix espanaensis (strain ATCC 51144 / DSM 44229 / JCM 9112 / NBRC 15066 / NRRL 15764) TaxID=1179773 RepID=K0K3K8_SACES|nr:dynamin family protein [Saccharothrix espanaensis]CCH32152.1 Isoniazid-inducible protein [Saccharothrix espanaensis DSM 44229]
MTGTLSGEVRSLLRAAIDAHRDDPDTADLLRRQLDRMDGPLRVAISGKVKAGKSTLLNALVGEEIAPTDAGECTRVVTWYRDGHTPRITLHPRDGAPRHLPVERVDGALVLDLDGTAPEAVERLTVDWPTRGLRDTTLIDTPGVASASTDVSATATRFLAPEDEPGEADAVIYLMRHLHSADLRLLESFHDRGVARATPVHTIAVLSRADEIGVGRIDALMSARRIARRYRADPRLRKLCQTVVPVAGLIAQTARTLRHDEFTALAALSAAPRAEVEAAMLSVDRFTRAGPDHARLLARFGLFGIRLSLTLVRQGFDDPARLAAELTRRSGLDELRETLSVLFTERRDLLKARSALLTVDTVLRRKAGPDTVPLLTEVERVLADAHELAELRTIGVLRSGAVRLPEGAGDEAERLLGGTGATPCSRLSLPADIDRPGQRAAAWAALERWQRWAENPLSSRAFVDVARVVVRSCEGMVDRLDD